MVYVCVLHRMLFTTGLVVLAAGTVVVGGNRPLVSLVGVSFIARTPSLCIIVFVCWCNTVMFWCHTVTRTSAWRRISTRTLMSQTVAPLSGQKLQGLSRCLSQLSHMCVSADDPLSDQTLLVCCAISGVLSECLSAYQMLVSPVFICVCAWSFLCLLSVCVALSIQRVYVSLIVCICHREGCVDRLKEWSVSYGR